MLVAIAGSAAAQPWRENVSQAQQDTAKRLLDEGNTLFADNKLVEALAKYELALAQWKHPAIQFNMVRCLIPLGRTLEAAEVIEGALQYGPEPLAKDVYREAVNYQKLLANQVGELEISCTQSGVALTLDGQPLPVCPSTNKRRALVGRHQVAGTRTGFQTRTIEIVVSGNDRQAVPVTLEPIVGNTRVVHRWRQWVPWIVFGSGIAVAGAGLALEFAAIGTMSDHDDLVRRTCQLGCEPDFDDARVRRARTLDVTAISVISIGGAIAITGGVMIYLNRGRTIYEGPAVAPVRGGAVVTWDGRF